MATREEIREGMKNIIKVYDKKGLDWQIDVVGSILAYLHSQGVVIKVDRELPETPYDSTGELPPHFKSDETATDMDVFLMHCNGIERGKGLMLKAGYVAVEPLIGAGNLAE